MKIFSLKLVHKVLLSVVCMVVFLYAMSALLTSRPALAQGFGGLLPFGGQVVSVQPCNTGLLAYIKTPMTGVMPFMWIAGNLPYLMRVPPHPGQYVLGMAGSVVPCVLGIVPMGAGPVIIFHGSGL